MFGREDDPYNLQSARQGGAPQRFADPDGTSQYFGNQLQAQQNIRSNFLRGRLDDQSDAKVAGIIGRVPSSPRERSSLSRTLGGIAVDAASKIFGGGQGSGTPWNFNSGLDFLGGSSPLPSSFSSSAATGGPDFNADLAKSVSFDFLR